MGTSIVVQSMVSGAVYDAWWDIWLSEKISTYIPNARKWNKNSGEIKVNDVIIFLKLDKDQTFGTPVWRIGIVVETIPSSDNLIRSVKISYKNAGESVFRTVTRSVRSVAVLFSEGELSLAEELAMARAGNLENVAVLRPGV